MKNWTIKEAIEVINANTDTAAVTEIAKHFPMFFAAVARNDMMGLAAMMPEKFTVRRLSTVEVVNNDDETEGEGENDAAEAGDEDLGAMSTKELIALCGKRGIKVPKYGKNKQFYLDALAQAADGEGDDGDDGEDAGENENPYEGKTAMELYKECKKRGIKAEPKKPAKYYIGLLTKADEEASEDGEGDDGDDWGDEDETEKKPAPKGKGAKDGKSDAKKSKGGKKAEPKDDDDDEWDI